MPQWEDVSRYTEQRTRTHRFSWTNLLIILNLTGFVIAGFLDRSNSEWLAYLKFDKATAIGQLHLWQFVTYSFVQLIDPYYIPWLILGFYVLYTIGNELEAEIGSSRYLTLYFGCAAYGALAHAILQYFAPAVAPGFAVSPAATLCAPVLGVATTASLRWPRRAVLIFFFLPMRLRTALAGLGILWLGFTYWLRPGLGPSVGGVLAAMAIAALEPRINRSFDRAALRRERNQFLEEVDVRRRTDGILDKISRGGMASLTRAERKTLKQASQILSRGKGRPHE
jgi:membrane associated rhomboid family serine protease